MNIDTDAQWKALRTKAKRALLNAFIAEEHFKVQKIKESPCPECAGTGRRKTIQAGTAGSRTSLCPTCLGTKKFRTVVYN